MAATATITWTAGSVTRKNMMHREETFRTYTSESFPGFRIEKWDGVWAAMETRPTADDPGNAVLCSTRATLAHAKALVTILAERAAEGRTYNAL